jgi:hypothetical protein
LTDVPEFSKRSWVRIPPPENKVIVIYCLSAVQFLSWLQLHCSDWRQIKLITNDQLLWSTQ